MLAGCTLDGEGDGSDPPGPPTIPLEEGQTVAELEVVVPADEFLLRGTIPVQPGVFDPDDGVQPFGVVDATGETYGAQAEVTTWYPDDAVDGADVVEVIARVSRGAVPIGQKASYRIVLAAHPSQPDPGTPDIGDLLDGPLVVPSTVEALLSSPGAIELRSYDCFGNKYLTYPLNGAGGHELKRFGEHAAEIRVYQHLGPAPPVTGSTKTLSHWLGAHAYISTWNSESIVGFDLRVTNADSGNDPTTSIDDPLDKVYFKSFEVAVPNGWVVVQDYEDPNFGAGFGDSGKTVFPIVKPLSGGKMHVIPWGGQFHRRLALCRVGDEAKARAFLRGEGLGFAKPGLSPESNPLWSWWNPATARWFPQSHLLPSLAHVEGQTVSNLVNERDMLKGHLENGTSGGGYPIDAPMLGWAHPYGVPYGGMTGGAEINIFDGMKTAWARELAGYQKFRMIHRMHSDRMPNALYNLDGNPTSAEDWLLTGGSGPYVPFNHFIIPSLSGDDAFGVYAADQTHISFVTGGGLAPSYEGELLNYSAHDYQHFSRYTRAAKVLSWLSNDSLAQDDLLMQAENFKLSYHPYNNGLYGGQQGTGMAYDITYVEEHPASGFRIGRGEGWGLDCSNAAYAAAARAWRAERLPWFDTYLQMVFDGQGACNGFLQANIQSKFLDAQYRARQAIEQVILDNGIRGMLETVYRGKDVAAVAMLEDVLESSFYGLISPMSWGTSETKPWQYTAVGPLDESLPVWCSFSQMPSDGYTPGAYDNFQNWSEFAYAKELTGDNEFYDRAKMMLGGTTDLLGSLEADGLDNIENRAALIALLQHENGDF